jgi:hypothetical protein
MADTKAISRRPKSTRLAALSDAQIDRLVYSLWDFQQALSALTFLIEDCDFDARYTKVELRRFRCYESSAIISFARPFEGSRGQTVVGLRAIGIELDGQENRLRGRLMKLRRKVIAHSDDDSMHYRALVHSLHDGEFGLPQFIFQESLFLPQCDHRPLEHLLRRLTSGIYSALFEIAQTEPARLVKYKVPTGDGVV